MANLSQLERVREIYRYIKRYHDDPQNESFKVTTAWLALKLNKTERQIGRDIAVLKRLIDERDREKGYGAEEKLALEFDKKAKSFNFTRDVDISVWVGRLDNEELGSLLVAQQALAVFSGMPLAKHVGNIFEEDAGGLVGNHRSALKEEITDLISFFPDGAGKIDQNHFAAIFRGLLLCRQLEVSYQSKASSAPVKRVLHPYHLCCFKHQWRLIAYDSKHDSIRDFVVTPRRLKSVKLLDRSFARPKGFNAHEHLSRYQHSKPQPVTLLVKAPGAHHVLERNWYGLRSVRELADGAVEAVFAVSDFGEFKRYVLAFGSDCEVLTPAEFREDILHESRKILGLKKN